MHRRVTVILLCSSLGCGPSGYVASGDGVGDDAIFSTYERRGFVDQEGALLEALFVDQPCE